MNAERLRELLNYDPRTGVFTWRIGRGKCLKGSVAGSKNRGYVTIMLDGVNYLAHRLAWLYVYGAWPLGELDHRFGVHSDNRIAELRPATSTQNKQNQHRAKSNNRCGFLGVSWVTRTQKWRATIKVATKQTHLGTFSTPEKAHLAYLKAKAKYHPFSTLRLKED